MSNLTQLDVINTYNNYSDINTRIYKFLKRMVGDWVNSIRWEVIDQSDEESYVRIYYLNGAMEDMCFVKISDFIKEINK